MHSCLLHATHRKGIVCVCLVQGKPTRAAHHKNYNQLNQPKIFHMRPVKEHKNSRYEKKHIPLIFIFILRSQTLEENDRCFASASPPFCVQNLFPQGTTTRLTHMPFLKAAKIALPWASQGICNTKSVFLDSSFWRIDSQGSHCLSPLHSFHLTLFTGATFS